MTTAAPRPATNTLRLALALCGFCAFINLYAPQAVLPLLAIEFGASAADISHILTASTLAVALVAPFVGTVADTIGRKRIIVTAMVLITLPTVGVALAPTMPAIIACRFVQGLMLPPIFAIAIAYIGEELSPRAATAVAGVYTAGASLGGFSGRFITGIVADWWGWRVGFLLLAATTLTGAAVVAIFLPKERRFVRSDGLAASARQMLRHFRSPQLVATYAVGFGVLFNFLVTFTYISFHLAAPPYLLSASLLGAIFLTYLAGSALTPLTGWAVGRFGRRPFVIGVLGAWMLGVLLTLAPALPLILVGLTLCAACGLICQAVSTGYVTITAQAGRSSAVGLYVTSFYMGGSVGAALGGVVWTAGRYPACAALSAAMLVVMVLIVGLAWSDTAKPAKATPIEPP